MSFSKFFIRDFGNGVVPAWSRYVVSEIQLFICAGEQVNGCTILSSSGYSLFLIDSTDVEYTLVPLVTLEGLFPVFSNPSFE